MSCPSGKVSYVNRSKAKQVSKTVKSVGRGNLQIRYSCLKLKPYQCRLCGMWHLTSQGKLPGRDLVDRKGA